MDPAGTPVADFGRLAQYGAVGIIAAGLLLIVVMVFRQLMNHTLKQNETMMARRDEMEMKLLESIHAVGQALRDLDTSVRHMKIEVSRDVADMVRDEVTSAGSRAHRMKPPR